MCICYFHSRLDVIAFFLILYVLLFFLNVAFLWFELSFCRYSKLTLTLGIMLCRLVGRKKIKMIINQFSQLSSSTPAKSLCLIFLLFISTRDNLDHKYGPWYLRLKTRYLKVVFITKLIARFIFVKNIYYITRQ